MTVHVSQCGCGAEVRREIPDGLNERWRKTLEKFPLVCEQCAEAHAAVEAEADELGRRRVAAERLKRSGIPTKWRAARLSDLDGSQPADAAVAWAAGSLRGLLLTGPVGVGKTHAAAAAAVAMTAERGVIWCSVPLLLAHLSTAFENPQHQAAIDALTGDRVLVLDDLDKVRATPYGAEQIFAAIDSRVSAERPLLVTTNLTLAEIADRFPQPFGEAIASRLAGYCAWYELTGADRRMGGVA